MITLEEVLEIHQMQINAFGGGKGVRDYELLEAAIYRPYQTFANEELYPTAAEKAAAIIESIVKNHPFIDGNKRTGYVLMELILIENNEYLQATQEEKYNFTIEIASGRKRKEEIQDWIKEHIEESLDNTTY